jgi:hypothetical protein
MRNRSYGFAAAVVLLLAVLPGCRKEGGASGQASLGSLKGEVAGITWLVPKRWMAEGERPMRVATYAVPAAEGDSERAECAVYFFGAGQGGDVNANIDRWFGQFENADAPVKGSREVNGIQVTTVQIAGTYLAPGGPMMASTGKKENYKLLGAIAEGPGGTVFFKMTGPAKTVTAASSEFDALVGSISK